MSASAEASARIVSPAASSLYQREAASIRSLITSVRRVLGIGSTRAAPRPAIYDARNRCRRSSASAATCMFSSRRLVLHRKVEHRRRLRDDLPPVSSLGDAAAACAPQRRRGCGPDDASRGASAMSPVAARAVSVRARSPSSAVRNSRRKSEDVTANRAQLDAGRPRFDGYRPRKGRHVTVLAGWSFHAVPRTLVKRCHRPRRLALPLRRSGQRTDLILSHQDEGLAIGDGDLSYLTDVYGPFTGSEHEGKPATGR